VPPVNARTLLHSGIKWLFFTPWACPPIAILDDYLLTRCCTASVTNTNRKLTIKLLTTLAANAIKIYSHSCRSSLLHLLRAGRHEAPWWWFLVTTATWWAFARPPRWSMTSRWMTVGWVSRSAPKPILTVPAWQTRSSLLLDHKHNPQLYPPAYVTALYIHLYSP